MLINKQIAESDDSHMKIHWTNKAIFSRTFIFFSCTGEGVLVCYIHLVIITIKM